MLELADAAVDAVADKLQLAAAVVDDDAVDDVAAAAELVLALAEFCALAAFAFLAALLFFDFDDDLRWDDAFPPASTHITYNFDFIYLGLFTLVTVHIKKLVYLGNYLQYLTRFKCGAGEKNDRT